MRTTYNVLKAFRINGRSYEIDGTMVPGLYAIDHHRVRWLLASSSIELA